MKRGSSKAKRQAVGRSAPTACSAQKSLSAAMNPYFRLMDAADGLMQIVEGTLGERWTGERGQRLVDMKEWCVFYSAWCAVGRDRAKAMDYLASLRSKPNLGR